MTLKAEEHRQRLFVYDRAGAGVKCAISFCFWGGVGETRFTLRLNLQDISKSEPRYIFTNWL